MKEKGFIIQIVVGAEYERMTVIDPMTRKIAFEGNTYDAMNFLNEEIINFKNADSHESN